MGHIKINVTMDNKIQDMDSTVRLESTLLSILDNPKKEQS